MSQTRTVTANASTTQGTPPQVSQSVTAPSAAPFNAFQPVQTSGPYGNASSWSSQSSIIAADRVTGAGNTNALANAVMDWWAYPESSAFASSSIEVVFDVSFPLRYVVSGSVYQNDVSPSPAFVALRTPTADVFNFINTGFVETPFSQSGQLAPGRYTLKAWASARQVDAMFTYFSHRSRFNFDFALESIVGDNYCSALPNSSGSSAVVGASGSDVVANADLTLHVSGAKPNAAGLFFYGPQQAPQPFGSGLLCVGAPRYRLHSPAQTNAAGAFDHAVDFNAAPAGSGASAFAPGVTWNFQFWYRDSAASPTFNTSNGLTIAFQ